MTQRWPAIAVYLTLSTVVLCSFATIVTAADSAGRVRIEPEADGAWFVEGDQRVMFYQRTTRSQDGKHPRANYVHPLQDLDGQTLTEDFPADHPHHRGIFWAWHQVWVGKRRAGDAWSCQRFQWDVGPLSWTLRADGSAELKANVVWRSPDIRDPKGQLEPIAREAVRIRAYPQAGGARAIDWRIELRAIAKEVRIGGSENVKGYGGFSTRVRLPDDLQFRGRMGLVTPEGTAVVAGPWIDLSGTFSPPVGRSGMTILCHPRNPQFPQPWILRRKGSMQNPVFPGRHAVALSRKRPMILRYRTVLHRGSVSPEQADRWQRDYGQAVR